MGAGVGEAVAVGRTAAEEPPLVLSLGGHGRADPDLDPVPLTLRHAAVERHHEIVGIRARIDFAADLGDPQLDPVVNEHREGQAELVAAERAGGLTDHYGVEATLSGP